MRSADNKNPLDLFAFPSMWLAVLVGAVVLANTRWGASGHPSRGLVVILYAMLSAPVFGLAGCVQAVIQAKMPFRGRKIAVALDFCLLIFGLGFWLWFWVERNAP